MQVKVDLPRALCRAVSSGVVWLALASASAQASGVNLEGIWQSNTLHPVLKPEAGPIPFTAAGLQHYADNEKARAAGQYDDYDHTISRCAAPGVPRVMLTPERFRILQQPNLIQMEFQWNRFRRAIRMPALPKQFSLFGGEDAALVGTVMGTSRGHWEGETLVITTNQFSERSLLDDLVPHGFDLKITERMRLVNSKTLEDRVTIEDPEFFTHPWQAVLTYERRPEAVLPEEVCLDQLLGPPPLPMTAGVAPTGADAEPVPGFGFGEPRLDGLKIGTHGLTVGPDGGLDLELKRNILAIPPLPAPASDLPPPSAAPRDLSGSWMGEQYMEEVEFQNDMYNSKLPLTALGRKILDLRLRANDQRRPYITPSVACRPSGPDWALIRIPLRIFQTNRRIDLISTADRAWWQIAIDPAIALPPAERSYMGSSTAHWDGDTLVVETSGFKARLWLTFRGTPLSPNGKLIHRIRKVHEDRWYLEIVTTVIDPDYYSHPWKFARTFMWRPDMGVPNEYNCEEQIGVKDSLNTTGSEPEPQD